MNLLLILLILMFIYCIFKNNNIENFDNDQKKDIDEMKIICKQIKDRKLKRKCNNKKKKFIKLIKTINNLEPEKVKIENNLKSPIKEDLSTNDNHILATVGNNNNKCSFLFNIIKKSPKNIKTDFPIYTITRNNRRYYGTKDGSFKTDLDNGKKEGKYFYFATNINDTIDGKGDLFISGDTQQNFFRDDTQQNFFRDDTQQNFFRDDTQQNFFRDDTQQNFFRDDTQQNFFRDDTQQNFFRDDTQQNFFRDDTQQNFFRDDTQQNFFRDNTQQNYKNIYIVNYYNDKVLKWNGNNTGHDFSFGNVNDDGTLFSIKKGLIRDNVCN